MRQGWLAGGIFLKKVFGCLAKQWYAAAALILLLAVQVFCELALPGITADIIDIGVGQSGISSALADSISAEGMQKLALLMTEEEQEITFSGYEQSGDVYKKKKMSSDREEELLKVMTPPMVAVYALTTEGADYKEVLGEDLYVPRDLDAFGILKLLPEDTRLELTALARDRIAQIPESLIRQAAINFLREDMKDQGIDAESIQKEYLMQKGIRMLLAALGMILAAAVSSFLAARFAAYCVREIREEVFAHTLAMEEAQAGKFTVAGLTDKTTEDVWKIQQFITVFFRSVLASVMLGTGASLAGWRISRRMGGTVSFAFLAGFLCMVAFSAAAARYSARVQRWSGRLKRTAHEQLCGLMVIRAFGSRKREEERMSEENRRWGSAVLSMNRILSFLTPMLLLIMNGSLLFLSSQSAEGINEGYLQSGELISCIQYVVIAVGAFLSLSVYAFALPEGFRAFSRTGEALRIPVLDAGGSGIQESGEKKTRPAGPMERKNDKMPAVSFNGVSFGYPQSGQPVLRQLSFTVEEGDAVAIIGGTGAGKTTLLRLILGEYKTDQGEILINGKDVRGYGRQSLSKKISYIPQDCGLFKGSVAENLRFRKEDASEQELWEALREAQAEDFVRQMEKGLEAEIAQSGKNLSGGQRQRIAAARALVGDAQLYLIDDCFSALDHITASRLRKALEGKIKGSTVLMAVSRISMAGNADKIIVLDQGKIVGMGSHAVLMQSCPYYRQLAFSQGIGEVTEDAR